MTNFAKFHNISWLVFCQSQICNHIHDKNNDENRKICQNILPMLCCRCFVEISLISIILFFVEQRKKIKKCKRKINFDFWQKNIKIVMISQVKLIGKFQNNSHATSSLKDWVKFSVIKCSNILRVMLQTVTTYLPHPFVFRMKFLFCQGLVWKIVSLICILWITHNLGFSPIEGFDRDFCRIEFTLL